MHQALLRWQESAKSMKNYLASETLRYNLAEIDNLKLKIGQYEGGNEAIANENEELR